MVVTQRQTLVGVKLERAKEHLAALSAEVRTYLDSSPYGIGTARQEGTRRLIYLVSSIRPTPVRVSAAIGDVLNNLRSALDHLAYQLVWAGTGKQPTLRVYFPIRKDRDAYIHHGYKQVQGATTAAIRELDAICPYRGGNDRLWQLHELNNVDKHRTLITAGSAFHSVNIGPHVLRTLNEQLTSSRMTDSFKDMPKLDLFLRPADRMFPLKEGDHLFIDVPDALPDKALQFRFDVAFGEPGVVEGEPILETLSAFVHEIESIIPRFSIHLQS